MESVAFFPKGNFCFGGALGLGLGPALVVIKIFGIYCNKIFYYTNLLSQILLQRFAYSDEAWSRQLSIQMDLNLRLSIYVEDRIGPSKVVISVMSATMSPMPKSEWKEKFSLKKK